MHYHLLQRNSMTVPRVDTKDYALAVDGYRNNADWETLKRIGDTTTCPIGNGMCGPMVTVDPVKFEDWELRPSHRQHQTQCWSDRISRLGRTFQTLHQLGQILVVRIRQPRVKRGMFRCTFPL